MLRLLLPIIGLAVLSGCAATPESVLYSEPSHNQYCFTKQDITVRDGEEVSSETKLDCSDNLVDKLAINRTGMAKDCEYYRNVFKLGGRYVQKIGLRCRLPNNDFVIVDDDIHN
jgi:hypothetical protein